MRASRWVAASLVTLAALAAVSSAGADPDPRPKAKASSFAPHHTKRHVYGAPIAKPIVHKPNKPKKLTPPAPGTSAAAAPLR